MIFLYSRKMQLLSLLCWCAGMAVMFFVVTGQRPLWLAEASLRDLRAEQARLGAPAPVEASPAPEVKPSAPAEAARPEADAVLNRCLALRATPGQGEKAKELTLTLDYVAALQKGFSLEKANGYYLADTPAYVIDFGRPWAPLTTESVIPLDMPDASQVEVFVSQSKHLRLMVRTRSMREAQGARLSLSAVDGAVKATLVFP
jgi:hypothetical protein